MRVGISKLRVENSATSKNLRVDILNIIIYLQKIHSVPVIFISFDSYISLLLSNILRHELKENTKITVFFDSLWNAAKLLIIPTEFKTEIKEN
jgi:hypothetical protein